MGTFDEKVGYKKCDVLTALHEVIVESALSNCGSVSEEHIRVLDALYHFVLNED